MSFAYTQVFYEDCEDTEYAEHFMEDHFGSNYLEYWEHMKAEMSQSTDSYKGSYSMTYDPFSAGNPYTTVGNGEMDHGNLSNFSLRPVSGRYWYFRWYQKWATGIDWGGYHVKLIYINYQNTPDFTYFLIKNGWYFVT